MKLTLERDALHAALGRVTKIVERRATIPILGHLHLVAADGHLTMRGTDLDMEATTSVAAEIHEAGRATAPATLLADLVAKMPSGAQIRLDRTDHTLVLKTGRSRTTLHTLAPEDFPDAGPRPPSHRFTLPAADLTALIARTDFAISNEEARYYMNGIFVHTMEVEGAMKMRGVATDGHRLARWEMDAPDGAAGMPGIIVPRKGVAELKRLAKDATGPIDVAVSTERLVATIPGKTAPTILATKLIDGTFPDYIRVIPRGNDKPAIVDRLAAIAAAERVATVSSERGRAVRLSFADHRLAFAVQSPDAGDAADEIDIDYAAAPIEIGFNVAYFRECLGVLGSDSVRIDLADPGSPTLLRESASDALIVVLMPMRV